MAAKKNMPSKKKASAKIARAKNRPKPYLRIVRSIKAVTARVMHRVHTFLLRRPHRSFRFTSRRDYKRSLELPGYWSFTAHVVKTLLGNWRLFGGLALVYLGVTIVVNGVGQQESYSAIVSSLRASSGDLFKGDFGTVAEAGLLLAKSVSTGLTPKVSDAQTVIGSLTVVFAWLATVWALRNTLAGYKPRLRDALYNSGSPVLSTLLVSFIAILQLLPLALALIVYTAANNSGVLESGATAMLVWLGILLFALLSLYWAAATFISLVIITLPGMYPMEAIRAAGDLVMGRRLRVLYRLIWLIGIVVAVWVLIMIPIILFDDWLKRLLPAVQWLPIVPLSILSLSSISLVFTSSYIYLLYRGIVDDESPPA
ncbi:hypothetical protein KC953_00175 [Candidatus Saccharibacteria bacterium]|nr:hypothetical protein [Candidatus Saccharibacteria bacterium]